MKATREKQIRKRAYEIWEQEGRPHGEDLKHWLKAFEEIGSEAQSTAKQSGERSEADKRAKTVAKVRKSASLDEKRSKDKLIPGAESNAANATVTQVPPKSNAQRKAVDAALSEKRGETPKSKLKGASKSIEKAMSEKQLEEFASTKTKGKPQHVAK